MKQYEKTYTKKSTWEFDENDDYVKETGKQTVDTIETWVFDDEQELNGKMGCYILDSVKIAETGEEIMLYEIQKEGLPPVNVENSRCKGVHIVLNQKTNKLTINNFYTATFTLKPQFQIIVSFYTKKEAMKMLKNLSMKTNYKIEKYSGEIHRME